MCRQCAEDMDFRDDNDFDGCVHGVGWDEECEECNETEDEIDGL